MRKKQTVLTLLVTALTIACLLYITQLVDMLGFSIATLSEYGSSGDEVRKIQTKLYDWGYYTGDIDGLYGYLTYSAVKSFQAKNGLSVDGIT
ncbi:MAG: peptidoglycan-binding domain-containing protein, partial [Bacillota bacterium]|nr:peptidoglycan-binding domain-containing protein [Bacillota bacterium]